MKKSTTSRGTKRKLAPYIHWTQRPANKRKLHLAAKRREAARRKAR